MELLKSMSHSPLQCFSLIPSSSHLSNLSSTDRGLLLIHLLLNCTNHVASHNFHSAYALPRHISLLADPLGDAMQRAASYFADALACRLVKYSLPGVYHSLNTTRPTSLPERLLGLLHFFDICPFLKLAMVMSSQAIVEAMEGEKVVHVVDLDATDPSQWVALLHMLSARREGPPHIQITGVNEHKEVLDNVAVTLSAEAERLDIPFQSNPVVAKLESLDVESLRVKTGEAVAISSILKLHTLILSSDDEQLISRSPDSAASPASSASSSSSLVDYFLALLWRLSPKIMVVAEQESNHNSPLLSERFNEALKYYAALFDCLESAASSSKAAQRAKVEKYVLGEEIKNIIACEGVDRRERHEGVEMWGRRMEGLGFARCS